MKNTFSRQEQNLAILDFVKYYLNKYPDTRFIQALWNLGLITRDDNGIEDRFYEEPTQTIEKLRKDWVGTK